MLLLCDNPKSKVNKKNVLLSSQVSTHCPPAVLPVPVVAYCAAAAFPVSLPEQKKDMKEKEQSKEQEEELLTLSEIARRLPEVGRPLLSKCASVFDVLPWHVAPGRSPSRRYYRLSEVKRTLKALEPLRTKEIPLKFCRAELLRLTWYREMRERETANE